jgi:hypothetical protein
MRIALGCTLTLSLALGLAWARPLQDKSQQDKPATQALAGGPRVKIKSITQGMNPDDLLMTFDVPTARYTQLSSSMREHGFDLRTQHGERIVRVPSEKRHDLIDFFDESLASNGARWNTAFSVSGSGDVQYKGTADGIKQGILAYFDNKYHDKMTKLKDQVFFVELKVEGLKGEITGDSMLWEKATLQCLYIDSKPEQILRLYLIIDGQWSAGLRKPADADYKSMQPKYADKLREYTDLTLTGLTSALGVGTK